MEKILQSEKASLLLCVEDLIPLLSMWYTAKGVGSSTRRLEYYNSYYNLIGKGREQEGLESEQSERLFLYCQIFVYI